MLRIDHPPQAQQHNIYYRVSTVKSSTILWSMVFSTLNRPLKMSPYLRRATTRLSQSVLQRVPAMSLCVKGGAGVCHRGRRARQSRPQHAKRPNSRGQQGGEVARHTPATAVGPTGASAACPARAGTPTSRSAGPGSHLLLSSQTSGQRRQRRAIGRTLLPNPAPAARLRLRDGQGRGFTNLSLTEASAKSRYVARRRNCLCHEASAAPFAELHSAGDPRQRAAVRAAAHCTPAAPCQHTRRATAETLRGCLRPRATSRGDACGCYLQWPVTHSATVAAAAPAASQRALRWARRQTLPPFAAAIAASRSR
jgi:hypothetical protein